MLKKIIVLLTLLCSGIGMAQYPIGHTTITFNDPTRTGGFGSGGGSGRQIQSEIYYPATSSGENTPVATGEMPVIVFGHGFAMAWDAYQNIWEEYVPKGYILVFPRTEGSLLPAPSHENFGKDLRLVVDKMQAQGQLSSSLFYQKVKASSAIIGHSMGGGATILAGASNSTIKTIVGMAPAETDPSAIAAAPNVTVPALIFSGSSDGVTPAADNHSPIYAGLASNCKAFISITGGAHCYFAESNFNCDFGESTSSTGISITREQQQATTYSLLTPWLDFYLKGNCDAFTTFENVRNAGVGITSQRSCSYQPFTVTGTATNSTTGSNGGVDVTVTGGEAPFVYSWSNGQSTVDLSNVGAGNYTITVSDKYCSKEQAFTVSGTTSLLEEINTLQLQVFPNPATDKVTVEFENVLNGETFIQVLDLSGKDVSLMQRTGGVKSVEVDVHALATGFYVLKISNAAHGLSLSKIYVKHD